MYNKSVSDYFKETSAAHVTAEALEGAAAVYGTMICTRACRVTRVGFVLTIAIVADATVPVVEFNHRPTPGSQTGETLIDNLTFIDAQAIGSVVYADCTPKEFAPGEELAFEHTVQADDSGSQAGSGFYFIELEDSPEEAANQSYMIESV